MARRLLSRHLLSACLQSGPAPSPAALAALAIAAPIECGTSATLLPRAWEHPSSTVQLARYAKHAGKGKGKGAAAAEQDEQQQQPAVEFSLDEPSAAMQHTIERFQHELAGVRTGRANPGLIESIVVDFQGDRMPLKACGTVTVRGSQTLAVAVYDPAMVRDVVKAIKGSPLSLNPQSEGGEILVQVPRMSKDTIEKMVKLVHMEAEAAKVRARAERGAWRLGPGGWGLAPAGARALLAGAQGQRPGALHQQPGARGARHGSWDGKHSCSKMRVPAPVGSRHRLSARRSLAACPPACLPCPAAPRPGAGRAPRSPRGPLSRAPHMLPPPRHRARLATPAGQHPARAAEGDRRGQEGVQQHRRAQGCGEEGAGAHRQAHCRGGAAQGDQGQGAAGARELRPGLWAAGRLGRRADGRG
jgi:ribosome recycling factor